MTSKPLGLIVGIDASRNRSGGAKGHLISFLTAVDPEIFGIKKVHLWTYQMLADSILDYPWLEKHIPNSLSHSLFKQLWWQYKYLPRHLKKNKCDIVLNTDAGSVCFFQPNVVMSVSPQ